MTTRKSNPGAVLNDKGNMLGNSSLHIPKKGIIPKPGGRYIGENWVVYGSLKRVVGLFIYGRAMTMPRYQNPSFRSTRK
jgi:hypothetical protein